jgi:hypothetical protein
MGGKIKIFATAPQAARAFGGDAHFPGALDFRYCVPIRTPDERDTVADMTSPLYLAAQFNALSEQEKKQVFSEGLGSNLAHGGLEFIVPLWWVFESPDDGLAARNGSAFLADFGLGCFVVSAAHVYRAYLDDKNGANAFGGCQLGNILFDPEARLICCRYDLDIATSASTLRKRHKWAKQSWPPIYGIGIRTVPHPATSLSSADSPS